MIAHYQEVVGTPMMIISLEDIGHHPQCETLTQVNEVFRQFL